MNSAATRQVGRTPWLRRRSVLAVNLAVCALLGWGLAGEYARHRDMRREIARLDGKAKQMEAENLQVSELARRLASVGSLEREARLNLSLRRPGEQVVILSDAPPAEAVEAAAEPARRPSRPGLDNAVKWWEHYFKKD